MDIKNVLGTGRILGNRILIKQNESESELKESKLILSPSAREQKSSGMVFAIGDETKEIKIGDEVVYDKYSGTELRIDGRSFIVVHEPSIIMILDSKNN
jgi:chaperonin GroES